jgi:U4/U6.U5 tri-snRNP-associated protein 1
MAVDEKPIVPRARELDANFIDDDELQASLARSRRAKLRKAPKLTAEELAQRGLQIFFFSCHPSFSLFDTVKRERSETQDAMDVIKPEPDAGDDRDEEGLTFDDTAEFVRTVGIKEPPKIKKETSEPSLRVKTEERSPTRDASMAPGDEAIREIEAGEVPVKEEEDEDDAMAMLDDVEGILAKADAGEFDIEARTAEVNGGDGIGTSNEQTFKSGMAATLTILRQQGILSTPSDNSAERESVQKRRDAWLAQQRHRIAERELEKLRARNGPKDQATREYENRLREQQEARETMEAYKDYKPDINIVYYDEYGRELTTKEAWKALSHKFHGKGPGKMKTEKKLKKIAEEKKQAAMASGDTPLSMNAAFQQRQLKTGQAHFVLSVGNKGFVSISVR